MGKAVLFLDKTSCDYYAEKMTTIPKLVFPAGSVQDIEVIDLAKLDGAIKVFIDTNKLVPSAITVVLSPSTLFMKDILKEQPAKPADPKAPPTAPSPVESAKTQEEQIEHFLDTVPFNEVSSITLPIQNGVKIIAANKELFIDIKRAFEKYKFTVEAVTPLIVFGPTMQQIDQQIARRLLAKVDVARMHNMLNVHPVTPAKSTSHNSASSTSGGEKKSETNKPRLFAMLGIFGLLMLVMVWLLYSTILAPTPTKPKPTPTPAPVVAKPTVFISPSVTQPVGSESASVDLSNISVQIISNAASAENASSLKTALTKAGVTTVTQRRVTTVPNKSLVSHSSTVSTKQLDELQKVINDILPSPLVVEAKDQAADVIITIGKPTTQ